MTITTASRIKSRLLVFTWNLRSGLLRGFVSALAYMRPFGDEFIPETLPLPFVQLEDGSVNSAIRIHIFQGESVVFLVGKEADHSPSTVWRRRCAQCHGQAADLFALLAEKNVLDRRYLDLHGGLAALLKLQSAVLNRQSPVRIVFGAFETQKVGDVSAERRGQLCRLVPSLGKSCAAAANEQDQVRQKPVRHPQVSIRRVFPLNNCVIHVFSPSPAHPEFLHRQAGSSQMYFPRAHAFGIPN